MIHTVTLNPAIDRLLFLTEFKKHITNRLQHSEDSLGGKGTHVSINLAALGLENNAFGIVHGNTGQKILDLLNASGVNVMFLHKNKENADSRTNYLIIEDNGDCSTISSKGVYLDEQDINELINHMLHTVKKGDFVILSGDATNCYDPYVYNEIVKQMEDLEVKLFLDSSGPVLANCISEAPYLIKPNLDELSTLVGKELISDEDILHAIESLSIYNIEIIAVSLGGDGSIVKTPEGVYKITPPKVDLKNPAGCGDCFLSGIIYGITNGDSFEETLRFATAISAATAESSTSVGFDLERAKELVPLVQIKKY